MDIELTAKIYFALAVNYNFDEKIALDSAKWDAWANYLSANRAYGARLLQAIEQGAMNDLLGMRTFPNLQDVKCLVERFKASERNLKELQDQREPSRRNLSPEEVKQMLDRAKTNTRPWADVDFKRIPRGMSQKQYVDAMINQHSGTKPKS